MVSPVYTVIQLFRTKIRYQIEYKDEATTETLPFYFKNKSVAEDVAYTLNLARRSREEENG